MSELSEIKRLLTEIKESDREIEKKLSEIHFSIFGNPVAKIKGIAEMTAEHEKYINADKRIRWLVAGALTSANVGLWAYIKSKFGI